MQKIPLLSGREVVKVFIRLGWDVARQRGSHIILVRKGILLPCLFLITMRLQEGL